MVNMKINTYFDAFEFSTIKVFNKLTSIQMQLAKTFYISLWYNKFSLKLRSQTYVRCCVKQTTVIKIYCYLLISFVINKLPF